MGHQLALLEGCQRIPIPRRDPQVTLVWIPIPAAHGPVLVGSVAPRGGVAGHQVRYGVGGPQSGRRRCGTLGRRQLCGQHRLWHLLRHLGLRLEVHVWLRGEARGHLQQIVV